MRKTASTSKRKKGELDDLAARATEAANVLSRLGNEKRLLILCYLMMGRELKVGDIVKAVGISQSALSQHLAKLREAGIVTFRRDSQTLYYRVADPRISKLIATLKGLYCD